MLKTKIIAFATILCLIVCSLNCLAAEYESDITTDMLFSDSTVIRANMSYYYKNGSKLYFDSSDKSYFPKYDGKDIYVRAAFFQKLFGADMSYDSASQKFTVAYNGKTLMFCPGEDSVNIDGIDVYSESTAVYNGVSTLFPLISLAKLLDIGVYFKDGLAVICQKYSLDNISDSAADELAQKFDEYIYSLDFDGDAPYTFYDWGTGRDKTKYGSLSDNAAHSGKNYVWVDAVESSFAGFRGEVIVKQGMRSMEVSCYAKGSSDYKYNDICFALLLYSGEKCTKVLTASTDQKSIGTEWTLYTADFASYDLMTAEYDRAYPAVCTRASGVTADTPATGRLYIDDFHVGIHHGASENIRAEIVSDSDNQWYILGDTVRYRCSEPEQLENIKSVTAKIFNLDGNTVFTKEFDKDEFVNRGFEYTPSEVGYYEVEFVGKSSDGSSFPIVCSYGRKINQVYCDIDLPRRSFVVAAKKTKSVEERNEFNTIVWGYEGDITEQNAPKYVTAIDNIGYGKVRMSATWGSTPIKKGFEPSQGQVDFENLDMLVNAVKQKNLKISWGFSSTPLWAAPEGLPKKSTVAGYYIGNTYAPVKWEYLENAVTEFMKHFKGNVSEIQIWNEPYYGNAKTAYWYDTKENFEQLTIHASKAAKEVDPNVFIWSAGHLGSSNGVVFLDDVLNNSEFADSIDGVTYHGSHNMVYAFKNVMDKHGFDKPYANSEAYPYRYGYNDKGKPKDYRINNMYFLMAYFYELKNNSDFMAMFELTEQTNQAERVFGQTSHGYGVYTKYPYFEPRQGAIVAHTLYDIMGKDFAYDSEYDFGEQKAVCFVNNGKKMLCVWNAADKDFELDTQIKSCMTGNTKITDFEGKTVSGTALEKLKMYYITDIDESALARVKKSDDGVINEYATSPYYTCKTKVIEPIKDVSGLNVAKRANTSYKPFDEKTFELSPNVEWSTDGWSWYGIGGNEVTDGYGVRSCFHIDDDGLYMLVDVSENTFINDGDYNSPGDMYKYDSIQFGFDTYMANDNSSRIECQLGLTRDGELLYKQNAPDIGATLPSEYTPQGKTMKKENLRIERTDGSTLYKIFIPTGELYPYTYPGSVNYCRLSVLVNENDGESRRGFMQWGEGIGTSKDVSKYGIITLDK